jgi:hypothetical protein
MLTDEIARIHIKNFKILAPQVLIRRGCEVKYKAVLPVDPINCPDHFWTSYSDTHHNHPIPPASKLSMEQKDAITKLASTMKKPTVNKIIKGNTLD